jgi:alpha-ribazole phosphatase
VRLIFVRHGETVYNTESRYQGHTDSELSKLGRKQAAAAGERLKSEKIAAVYSSDLSRAADTARAIAAHHNLAVQTDDALRECAFGEWEGLSVKEIADAFPELYENYRRDSVAHRAPNGERLEGLQERVVRAVNCIAERHPADTVVIVTHGGPIRAFFCHAFGAELQTFRKMGLDNGGITTLSLDSDGRWFLEVLNDTCHLEALDAAGNPLDETSAQDGAR